MSERTKTRVVLICALGKTFINHLKLFTNRTQNCSIGIIVTSHSHFINKNILLFKINHHFWLRYIFFISKQTNQAFDHSHEFIVDSSTIQCLGQTLYCLWSNVFEMRSETISTLLDFGFRLMNLALSLGHFSFESLLGGTETFEFKLALFLFIFKLLNFEKLFLNSAGQGSYDWSDMVLRVTSKNLS